MRRGFSNGKIDLLRLLQEAAVEVVSLRDVAEKEMPAEPAEIIATCQALNAGIVRGIQVVAAVRPSC